jgi:anthranilate synthase/aminodeoxychorismate synthase-like glutamine amidotransferase
MILLLDNYDSFTYNLADYLQRIAAQVMVRRNDVELNELTSYPIEGLLLSPGPSTPSQAGNLMAIIEHYVEKQPHIPILGVCLGHQALGEYFGAQLVRASYPMHGKLSQIYQQQASELFAGLPLAFDVVRYHSLLLTDLPDCLQPLAQTAQGELMAFQHHSRPIYGVQFHPEAALTQYGLELLRNWYEKVVKNNHTLSLV